MSTATDRVALVTGGSGGIGHAVAGRLAKDGLAVAVHNGGSKDRANEIVAAITADDGTGIAVAGDVADGGDMNAVFDAVASALDGIDVVMNMAGIMILSPIAALDLTDLDRMHRINIRSAFVVAQQAARRVRQGGAVVNISTSVTRTRLPTYAAYVASKAAVQAITLILARELRGKDITVNAARSRPNRHTVLPGRQGRGDHRRVRAGHSAGAPRPAVGRRRNRVVPGRPGPLGQRPGDLHRRRTRLTILPSITRTDGGRNEVMRWARKQLLTRLGFDVLLCV